MRRTPSAAAVLAERLCRPQRIGVFGHRGVGKTTLLTMLYREGVGGRLPALRLAAADARTANYLSDKVLQLECGQALPATLAETDLRFHLYHGSTRLELLMKDYQGEHVELGRAEPIGDFLRDCDAVWLCLDAATVTAAADRLRRQQEVEQLVEQFLAVEPLRTMDRPVALVLTKADLLADGTDLHELTGSHFDMVRHALRSHCPHNGLFAVSSLGRSGGEPRSLEPRGLGEPLAWLATTLQAQDEARLAKLWTLAERQPALLERCVACFAHRYPDVPATAEYRRRLRELRWRLWRRRGLATLGSAAALVIGLWSYDALAYHQAERFEQRHAGIDAATVLQNWQRYQTWHPSRNLLRSRSAEAEASHLEELGQQARQQQGARALAELRRQASDADADPEKLWQQFQVFHAGYPEADVEGELQQLRTALKARRDGRRNERAQRVFDELIAGEQQAPDLLTLVSEADHFLRDFDDTPHAAEVRNRRDAYLGRLDGRDIEFARNYSARQPLSFQTRREAYQHYLDKHPSGTFAEEARRAVQAIDADWDKYDFRAVRDHFLTKPGDVAELVTRCRTYLAAHPQGKFRSPAEELLRWSERVTAPQEYRVVLHKGTFDKSVARWVSRGPQLSVDLEVAGARYGPSPVVLRRYDPDWNYEFPRKVRWKLGDPVRVRVTEHCWSPRVVAEFASEDGDPLGLKMLTGQVWSGPNSLTFECDFTLPTLPNIE
jgi:GTPase SAR1 family protein